MLEQEVTLLCAEAYRPLESVHRRAESEPLDGFLEIRESAVLDHDLMSYGKFLEQEYSDYFCLL